MTDANENKEMPELIKKLDQLVLRVSEMDWTIHCALETMNSRLHDIYMAIPNENLLVETINCRKCKRSIRGIAQSGHPFWERVTDKGWSCDKLGWLCIDCTHQK